MAGLAVSCGSWLLGFSSTSCVEDANSPENGRNGEQDSGSQGGVDQKMDSHLPKLQIRQLEDVVV